MTTAITIITCLGSGASPDEQKPYKMPELPPINPMLLEYKVSDSVSVAPETLSAGLDQLISKRSRFITFVHAAMKSRINFSLASAVA